MHRAMHWELGGVNYLLVNIVINAKVGHGIIVRRSELLLTNEFSGSSKMKVVHCLQVAEF